MSDGVSYAQYRAVSIALEVKKNEKVNAEL